MESNEETQQDDCESQSSSRQALSNLSTPVSVASEEGVNNPYKAYFMSLPPGYRFYPTDEELLLCYLSKKVKKEILPPNQMVEVNLYLYNPEYLAATCKDFAWQNGLYFFTPRDRKYRNGIRPKRSAGDGYWKATGADRSIYHKARVIGYRKALVFYIGKAPKGTKTNWIMHEYKLNEPLRTRINPNDMRLDDWVLCKIHKKNEKTKKEKDVKDEDQTPDGDEEEDDEMAAEFNGDVVDPRRGNYNNLAAVELKMEPINSINLPQPPQLAPLPLPLPPPPPPPPPPSPQLPLLYPMEDAKFRSVNEQFMREDIYYSRPPQIDPLYNNYNYAGQLVPWNNILPGNIANDPLNNPLWGSIFPDNDPPDSFYPGNVANNAPSNVGQVVPGDWIFPGNFANDTTPDKSFIGQLVPWDCILPSTGFNRPPNK